MAISIHDLPNEVIQHILLHASPLSIPAFQQTCQRFNHLADALIWRQHCRSQFRYWSPEHLIKRRLAGPVDSAEWKTVFARRHVLNRHTTRTLDSILSSQMGRIDKFQQIVEHGYDVKDCLLGHLRVDDDAEDVLARR